VPVDEHTVRIDLIPHAAYLKDASNTLAIDSAMTDSIRSQFRPSGWTTTPNFGFTPDTHWFRYRIISRAAAPSTWYVEVNRPRLDWIGFYIVAGNQVVHSREAGNMVAAAPRDVPVRPFVFKLTLDPGAEVEVFMAFRSEAALWIPLSLWGPEHFWNHYLRGELWNLLFFGYMLALTVVAIFMAWITRDKGYLIYIFTTMTIVCFLFCFMQYPAFFGLPGLSFWCRKGMMVLEGLGNITFLYYTRYIFGLPNQTPKLDRFMRWTIGCFFLTGLAVMPFSYAVIVHVLTFQTQICMAIVIIVSAVYAARGSRIAIFYMAAWLIFLLAVVLRCLALFGWLSAYWEQDVIIQWAAMFGYTLFLLAIGDRIRQINRDRLSAQAQLLAAQATMTHELERQVRERTESLHQAKETAERARQAMSHFLINVVHDIRAPLNAVFGLAQALWLESEKLNLPEQYCRFLARVRAGGNALSNMLANLFDLSQIELGKPLIRKDSFTVNEWVEELRPVIGLVAEDKGVHVQWQVTDGARVLRADRIRCSQILMNLAYNAIKFTPTGGRVRIGLETRAEQFILTVDDEGPGIPEERKTTLWDRDAQIGAERQGEGLGLGLFIVKTNAELLGGSVSAGVLPAGGAHFEFRIPLTTDAGANGAKQNFSG